MIASREDYTDAMKAWLAKSGHYLENPSPGCFFMVAIRDEVDGLFGPVGGALRGMVVVGRPVARALPQGGSWGEVLRLVLHDGLPHGTASWALQCAILIAAGRRMEQLISYHDRTRHTGCIYKKAGFKKDGVTNPKPGAWGSRANRKSAQYDAASKRRWRYDLRPLWCSDDPLRLHYRDRAPHGL